MIVAIAGGKPVSEADFIWRIVNGGVIMRWSGGVRMYHWHGGSLSA